MENNSLNSNIPQQDINQTDTPKTDLTPETPKVQTEPAPTPIDPIPENNVLTTDTHSSNGKKSRIFLFALGCVLFFVLLIGLIGTSIVLAAYNKITLPNQKWQESISYFVQDLPFMPKTPKYILLKSAKVHENIGSAYTKISAAIKSDEFSQIPGIGNTLEILGEGPIDAQNPENPKMSWNIKVTKEFDADFKVSEKIAYFKVNKIPTLLYPFIGLNSNNFANNPYLNRWVYYDFNSLETDSSKLLDERGENVTTNELTETKLILLGNKLNEKMIVTEESFENTPTYKLSLKLSNQDLQELEPEIVELLDMRTTDYDSDVKAAQDNFSMIDNVELYVWIEKSTYYLRKFDFAADVHENKMNNYSQVLGIKTVATEPTEEKVASIALSISLSQLGENFEEAFKAPSNAISFEQYTLEISSFMNEMVGGYEMVPPNESSEGFDNDELSGFENPQLYSPPTGKTPLSY